MHPDEGASFADGRITQTVDFPFEEIDRHERGNSMNAEIESSVSPWEFLLAEPRARQLLARMNRVVVTIAQANNSKMSAEAFLIAIGDDGMIKKQITTTAKRHGVCKAAVSKACVDWCEYLGKKPSAYMRSEASKLSFKQHNTRKKKS